MRSLSVLSLLLLLTACQPQEQSGEFVLKQNSEKIKLDQSAKASRPIIAVNEDSIIAADNTGWLSHGRTYAEERYSPLTQITVENVEQLGLAWSFDLNVNRGIEATPIVHNGVMYVSSAWNIVYALDARTGKPLWRFDPEVDKAQAAMGCCGAVNRGVAIWGDDIFTGTLDGRLISLDAKTGSKNWDVLTIDKSKPYTITGAPRIVKGKVIIGNGGAELGVRGYVSAYNAETGDMEWRFYTVPGNPENGFENDTVAMAAKTWTGEYWKVGGGGTVWDSMAYDPKLELLYIGVGNGSPWSHELRSPDGGDNLFLSSIVALKPDTGEYVWHYQTTPAENWDYTATQHMILADLDIDGQARKVIMQAPKNGFFYVIDRITGELISANNFVPVNWATHIDLKTGRPLETETARYSDKPVIAQLPGPAGAHNWHPMSYSPDTGLVYIPAQQMPYAYARDSKFEYKEGAWNNGVVDAINGLPNDEASFKAVRAMLKGNLVAWDPIKQQEAWSYAHAGPWNGGTLATKGGLVFQGTADAHFAAFDAANGDKKWDFYTQTGIVSGPITYQLDGDQYVAVAGGWGGTIALSAGGALPPVGHKDNASRVLVFKLNAKGKLPDLPTEVRTEPQIPKPLDAGKETLTEGMATYMEYCVTCHGVQAQSFGSVPNLRYSAITRSAQAWSNVVLGGAFTSKGMPNFGKVLSDDQAQAIRAYVISEANSPRDRKFYQRMATEK